MLLSAMFILVVVQSNSEIPEGLMNNPVFSILVFVIKNRYLFKSTFEIHSVNTRHGID